MIIHGFEPIVNKDSRMLILGSMPGKESLIREEYYGNRRNSFWKIAFDLFDEEYNDSYEEKLNLLKKYNIALWDVIYECERKSSLDSDIRRAKLNDFNDFFKSYNIDYVFINGGKAYDLFTKKLDASLIEDKHIYKLDSTSPARAIPYKDKLANWSVIKDTYNQLK